MTYKILISVLLINIFAAISFAQVFSQNLNLPDHSQYGNKTGLYLIRENLDEAELVVFRLDNKTPWAISIRRDWQYSELNPVEVRLANGQRELGLADKAEIKLEYFIESPLLKGGLTGQYGCTFNNSWVAAGQSVYFKVPREAFPKLARLYVIFRYEWEDERANTEHRAIFKWDELKNSR